MKFRSASASTEAAMQLLVDPMCNFFAGLVFLSVLVAVLARNEIRSPWREELERRTFANPELLTARMAEIRDETQALERQNREAAARLGGEVSLPSLTAVEKAMAEALGEEEAGGGTSAELRARVEGALIRERDRLRSRQENLGNEIAALREEKVRLQGRLGILEKEPAGVSPSGSEVRIRLPLARPAEQTPLYILISGGRCYPLQDPDGKEDDTHVVRKRSVAADEVNPREGRGLAAGPEMEKFLQRLDSRRQYPVLVVYADSFAEYQALRGILESRQLPYGWEARPVGMPLRLSAQGAKPEVQ